MAPVYSQPRPGRAMAIVSLVLSCIAVLGVFVIGGDATGSGTGSDVPLTGQLSTAPSGQPVTGATLAKDVTARINQDGGDVSRMDCPSTSRIGQGVVTVCHGTVSGSDYAVIVFFEDDSGRFTLNPV